MTGFWENVFEHDVWVPFVQKWLQGAIMVWSFFGVVSMVFIMFGIIMIVGTKFSKKYSIWNH